MSAVASGFSAVEGGLGLLGVESEKLQETMLRVQSAMALAQGLEGLEDAGRAFKNLGVMIKDAAIKLGILTVVKEADTVATTENVIATEAQVVANQQAAVSFKATGVAAKTSLNGVKAALAATGIGLFLVALGTIAAYWDDIKAAVSGVSKEQAKLNKLSHDNFETSKEQLSNLDAQDNILKLQGKSEREILNLKIAKVNTAIELGKIELENVIRTSKAEEEAAIKNYNLTKSIVNLIIDTALFLPKLMLKPIDLAIQGANKVSEILGFGKAISFDVGKTIEGLQDKASDFIAGSIFNVPELKKENEETAKEIRKSIADLENQKAGFQLSIKEMDKAEAQKTIDANKEKNDLIKSANAEAARLAIEQQNELNKRLEDIAEQNFQNSLTEQEREILLVNDKYFELETLAEGNKDALAEIELAKMNELNDINLKYQNIAYENDKVAKEKKIALEKETAEKQIALENNLRQTKLKLTADAFGAIGQLIESFNAKDEASARKQFKIAKAFNLSSALVNTALAVTSALAMRPDQQVFPGQRFIEAGTAGVVGLANVAKIASTQFGSSNGGGGVDVPNPSSIIAPNLNVVGNTGINQLATLQQQPVKAYVVSNDITSAQQFDMKVQQTSQL
jgi:hypothetical protein